MGGKGPSAGADLGRVLVLGLGKSGKSVARYCAGLLGGRVSGLFIAAGAETDDSRAFVESLARDGVGWAFGDDALAGAEGAFDLCVASPGIPFWHELYVAGERLSRELVSEVEFAWRESDPESTWVAVTGTNGKTTTTALAAHILRACGFGARAVGNIGEVCLDAVAAGGTRVYVAEVSSYQLASTRRFAPDVAVLLNVTPDHLHWHRSFEAYRDAKFSLFKAGKIASGPDGDSGAGAAARRGVAILDATDDVVRGKFRELRAGGARAIPLGTAEGIGGDMRARCGAPNAAFVGEGGALTVAFEGVEHRLGSVGDLKVEGEHNASNALAAAAVAVALGADDARIAAALASFEPLAHRIEPCGRLAGMACYNDSKATNVDAACKALASFPARRVVILLGGEDKGTDLADLVEAVHARAVAAVCYGEAGPRFARALEEGRAGAGSPDQGGPAYGRASRQVPHRALQVVRAARLRDAFDAALSFAGRADVLLLSPACASFDEFRSFEERGDVFKRLVADRAAMESPARDGAADAGGDAARGSGPGPREGA